MMRPVENLRLDQRFRERLRKPFARRINVFAEIRMMNETFAADFQLRFRRQTLPNPRENCAGPLRGRAAPRLRPFLTRLFPIVLHLQSGWGAESNRRHVDFQSMFPMSDPSRIPFA